MQAAATAPLSPLAAGLLRRVRACNNGLEAAAASRPLVLAGSRPAAGEELGLVLPEAAAELAHFPEVFRVTEEAVELTAGGSSVEERSKAVGQVLDQLRRSGRVPMLEGWRNEGWPVKASFDAAVELVIERAAGPFFGVRGFGCHINGLVPGSAGEPPRLWVARRAATKPTYPGKLDHMVAGGLAHGQRPGENVIKECEEEASVPRELASLARPAGFVSYCQREETGWGLKRDLLFCYDLELRPDFVPQANDGEVESFRLWELQAAIDSVVEDNQDWKPNVVLVIIDMLVRRGYLAPEEVGYTELVRSLRS